MNILYNNNLYTVVLKKHELEEGWIEKGRRATLEVSSLKAVKASVPWFAACWEGAPQTSNY